MFTLLNNFIFNRARIEKCKKSGGEQSASWRTVYSRHLSNLTFLPCEILNFVQENAKGILFHRVNFAIFTPFDISLIQQGEFFIVCSKFCGILNRYKSWYSQRLSDNISQFFMKTKV